MIRAHTTGIAGDALGRRLAHTLLQDGGAALLAGRVFGQAACRDDSAAPVRDRERQAARQVGNDRGKAA